MGPSDDSSNNSQAKKAPAINITTVHISDILSGQTPFPHPNTATPQELDPDQTLVMEEEMVLSPAPFQSASKPAAALGTTVTNLSLQECHVDLTQKARNSQLKIAEMIVSWGLLKSHRYFCLEVLDYF